MSEGKCWTPRGKDVAQVKFCLAVTGGFRRVVKVYKRDALVTTLIFSGRGDITIRDVMDVLCLFDRLAGEGARFEYF